MVDRPHLLICGGTGFIGRNLLAHFAARRDVRVTATHLTRPPVDIPGVTWRRADLRDPTQVDAALAGVDILIQAAATTSGAKEILERPYIHTTDNAVMNSLLLRAAFHAGVRHFVFFSCLIMYHDSATPLKETDFDPARPLRDKYFAAGHTKLYVEKMCEFYSQISPMRTTVVRHSNVYGPHDKYDLDRSHVTGATITKVMTAKDDRLRLWGTGAEARDLLHVDDLVDFVARAVDRQESPFGLYNVGAGEAISVRALAETIARQAGRDMTLEFDREAPTIPTSVALDCGKAARELGWHSRTSLEAGIASTLDWYRREGPGAGPSR